LKKPSRNGRKYYGARRKSIRALRLGARVQREKIVRTITWFCKKTNKIERQKKDEWKGDTCPYAGYQGIKKIELTPEAPRSPEKPDESSIEKENR